MTFIRSFEDTHGFRVGAGIGALVLTGAGAAWALTALIFRVGTPAWAFVAVALPVLALTVLAIQRLSAVARSNSRERTTSDRLEGARRGRRMGRLFATVFGIEIALIALCAVMLARVGRPLLIPVAVTAIVGAHFVPLGRIFRVPTYAVLGVILVAMSGVSLLIGQETTRVFLLSIASALALWVSAAAVLLRHVSVPPSDHAVLAEPPSLESS